MSIEKKTITVCRCERCGQTFAPRKWPPLRCGKCGTPYWNKPRKK